MQREVTFISSEWTVGQTLEYIAGEPNLPEVFYDIFVVDSQKHPLGAIAVSNLLKTSRQVKMLEIMDEEIHKISVILDQEDVAHVFRQYSLVSANKCLVGMITVDDVTWFMKRLRRTSCIWQVCRSLIFMPPFFPRVWRGFNGWASR